MMETDRNTPIGISARLDDTAEWRKVYDFWFPPGLDEAPAETHRGMFAWWFAGGSNKDLPPFLPVIEDARAGRLDHWLAEPPGRLSLILVLDQFPRGLFSGTPEAYASDPDALRLAEEGLSNGHYDALAKPWEKTFFLMPLVHAEGPDHRSRIEQVVALTEAVALEASAHLKPLYLHSVSQARGHLEVIARFGRFPHRNPILGRRSTHEERAYLEKGDFVYNRQLLPG
jgi:uncharacterized protein (DUF924 family)